MSFPNKGKFFPKKNRSYKVDREQEQSLFVDEIASSLQQSLGNSRVAIKTVVTWTGANEKTVKNWFAGRYGPSGPHLVALVQHSDEILSTFLSMAGREDLMVSTKLKVAEEAIKELLSAIQLISKP